MKSEEGIESPMYLKATRAGGKAEKKGKNEHRRKDVNQKRKVGGRPDSNLGKKMFQVGVKEGD